MVGVRVASFVVCRMPSALSESTRLSHMWRTFTQNLHGNWFLKHPIMVSFHHGNKIPEVTLSEKMFPFIMVSEISLHAWMP